MLDEASNLQELVPSDLRLMKETVEKRAQLVHMTSAMLSLCRSINGKVSASTPPWIPESQPSFPLDAEDQITLVLCMLTSIYGGAHVLRKLIPSGDRDLLKHIKKVRALQSR